jgi:diguanylate cyclase (GGDEF)-like protein
MNDRTRQTILIVDDQSLNREILENILQEDYRILNAENGKKALEILAEYGEEISAVLLDLLMPVMDGYQFLDVIQSMGHANLPIIVMTGENSGDTEEKALEKGAWDFINKPYQPAVLKGRLRNAITRSKLGMLDQLQYMADHDPLTGLYNRSKFMKETRAMIDAHPELKFAVIRVDIDRFSLLNSFWGEKGGDEFLKYLGVLIQDERAREPIAVYGRINADVFCICEQYNEAGFRHLVETVRNNVQKYNTNYFVKPTFGVCLVDDPTLPIEVMYERAAMAARTCKGKYNENIGYYNNAMHETTMRDQRIVNEMQRALELKQFQVYLQPKYSLKTNKPYGAEALVRWKHPEKGMVSPADFIPVFERNGFIGKLDYFMWDAVGGLLRKWIDEGLEPAPVSVNISRVNMYNPKIVEILCELAKNTGFLLRF